MFDPNDIRKNRAYAAIGYISFLCFVPLIFRERSAFALYHGKQGAVLFAVELAAFIFSFAPLVGQIIWIAAVIICVYLSLKGYFSAMAGRQWVMPVLGRWAKKIKF